MKSKNKGITLIALVITIIVMLVLVSVTVSMAINGGLFEYAGRAVLETRAASVEEAKNIWETEKLLDSYTSKSTAKTLDELLAELESQNLLTAEEVATIKETGKVVIGSRIIEFTKGIVKLEACVRYSEGKYQEEDTIRINIGIENFKTPLYYQMEIVEQMEPGEKEQVEIDYCNYLYGTSFNDITSVYEYYYENDKTSMLCTSLEDLADAMGWTSANELIASDIDYLIDKNHDEYKGIREEYESQYLITGTITDPNGTEDTITNSDILWKFGRYYFYEYIVSEYGTYTFNYEVQDGQTGEITVKISEDEPIIVTNEYGVYDYTEKVYIMQGINNFVKPEKLEFVYKGQKIDLTSCYDETKKNFNLLNSSELFSLTAEYGPLYGQMKCTYNGKEISQTCYVYHRK